MAKGNVRRTGMEVNGKKKSVSENRIKRKKPASLIQSPYIVCIGASAGGLNAVSELLSQLKSDINAAIFIVLHLSKNALGDILLQRIRKSTVLPCQLAAHEEPVVAGHIYLAVPDHHLLVNKNKIVLGKGVPENRFRPSIDVFFRSAAVEYREKTIGVILTGFLSDGTAGMVAIRQCGGFCLVQDPNEAEHPDMPLSVLETLEVDHCLPLNKLTKAIEMIIEKNIDKSIEPPEIIIAEAKMSEKAATSIENVAGIGEKTLFSCPDCGGGLWSINNGATKHFRCHIGHSYTKDDLLLKQTESVESTLWIAVRMMEERKVMLKRLAGENSARGLGNLSKTYHQQAVELDKHIHQLKGVLLST